MVLPPLPSHPPLRCHCCARLRRQCTNKAGKQQVVFQAVTDEMQHTLLRVRVHPLNPLVTCSLATHVTGGNVPSDVTLLEMACGGSDVPGGMRTLRHLRHENLTAFTSVFNFEKQHQRLTFLAQVILVRWDRLSQANAGRCTMLCLGSVFYSA